jgi:hypothetical protein
MRAEQDKPLEVYTPFLIILNFIKMAYLFPSIVPCAPQPTCFPKGLPGPTGPTGSSGSVMNAYAGVSVYTPAGVGYSGDQVVVLPTLFPYYNMTEGSSTISLIANSTYYIEYTINVILEATLVTDATFTLSALGLGPVASTTRRLNTGVYVAGGSIVVSSQTIYTPTIDCTISILCSSNDITLIKGATLTAVKLPPSSSTPTFA